MKVQSVKAKQSGNDVNIIVKNGSSSVMYRVHNSNEKEALDLFEKNSHRVQFIGRLDW